MMVGWQRMGLAFVSLAFPWPVSLARLPGPVSSGRCPAMRPLPVITV